MTITVERLFDLDLITKRMHKVAAEEGIESVEVSQGGLTSIKGIGEKRAQSIIDELPEEETDTTNKEEKKMTEEKDVILRNVESIEKVAVNAYYLGDSAVNLDAETYVADLKITYGSGHNQILEVSLIDGNLEYETYGDDLRGKEWEAIKMALIRAYKKELGEVNEDPEEVLVSGEQMKTLVEDGFREVTVDEVYYKEELADSDLVADVTLIRGDGSYISGEAIYNDESLFIKYEDALDKEEAGDEVPDHVTKHLIGEIRKVYTRKKKRAEADFNTGENTKDEGVNPVRKNQDEEETVLVKNGMVVKVNGRRLIKEIPATEYFAQEAANKKRASKKPAPKTKKAPVDTNPKRKQKTADHGLDRWSISKLRDDLEDITNGTAIADVELEAGDKKAQFVAVFYNGSLRFFDKDQNTSIKREATAQFITDKVRDAYIKA